MEEAKNKEKKQSEKTEERETKPTGKDKDKKEEQELVSWATFLEQGKQSRVFAWVTHCLVDMVEQAESVIIQNNNELFESPLMKSMSWLAIYQVPRIKIIVSDWKRAIKQIHLANVSKAGSWLC